MKDFTRSGAVMKAYREKMGMTQTQLGKPFSIHAQFVSNNERGICLLPANIMKKLFKHKDFPKVDFIEALKEDLIESHMQKYK